MARPSPLAFKRAPRPEWTLTGLGDPAQPDWTPVDWTLRRLDPLAQSEVGNAATAFLAEYAAAGGYLPTLAGDALPVTADAAKTAAAIHAMQVRLRVTGEAEDLELFSLAEVYAMLGTLPDAWQRVEIVALVLAKGQLPLEAQPLVDAEGPGFAALAVRHGCFREASNGGNPPGGTQAPSPSPSASAPKCPSP